MNLQAEKIELIKLIADIQSEKMINKIKDILAPSAKKTKAGTEDEEALWKRFSTQSFLNNYAENEPEYKETDIKEPNVDYREWKEK